MPQPVLAQHFLGRALPEPLKLAALELLSGNFTVGFGIHSHHIEQTCGLCWEGKLRAAGRGGGCRAGPGRGEKINLE